MRLSSCNTEQLLKVCKALQNEAVTPAIEHNKATPSCSSAESKYRFVTGNETEQILNLYQQGLSASEVGRRVGRPLRTVTDVLRRNGVKIRKHTPTSDDTIAKMVSLYESGQSCAEIAKELGVSSSNVGKHLQGAGITMRSKRDAALLRRRQSDAAS